MSSLIVVNSSSNSFWMKTEMYTRKNITACQEDVMHCLFPVVDKSGISRYHLVTRLMRPRKLAH